MHTYNVTLTFYRCLHDRLFFYLEYHLVPSLNVVTNVYQIMLNLPQTLLKKKISVLHYCLYDDKEMCHSK